MENYLKVYNLNEITDSKVQYDKKPPALMFYVVLIVTVLIGIGLIWANNSVKTYVVKGQGMVVTENKSHIMTKTSGEIREVFVEEGKEVKAGDKLFSTSELETSLQLEQINAQIQTYENRISLLSKAEENATNGTNYFDKNNEVESEFYNRLSEAYLARKEFNVDTDSLKKQGYDVIFMLLLEFTFSYGIYSFIRNLLLQVCFLCYCLGLPVKIFQHKLFTHSIFKYHLQGFFFN